MYNILISGYYGFNNIGDESILRTVIDNLREKLPDIDITVLSHDPAQTSAKYGVKAARRMSLWDIFRSVLHCDLLLSGGGSLLQDATSARSILYYLFILRLAQLMGKKTFIYSQGIGPISDPRNRWLTAATLRRTSGIVVRDAKSRDLLLEIGVPEYLIHVTADPVIRVKKADPALGLSILEKEGCTFVSATDTEVVAHLINYYDRGDIRRAIEQALHRLEGSYALGIICQREPDTLYCVRKDSPLVVGLGDGQQYIASDIPAILPYTRDVYFLQDREIAVIRAQGVTVYDAYGRARTDMQPFHVDWDVAAAEKGGYPHFMLKEIMEEPRALMETMR